MHQANRWIKVKVVSVTGAMLLAGSATWAATMWWDGPSAGWTTVSSWSLTNNAATPDPDAVPSSGDVAIFNLDGVNTPAPSFVSLNEDQSVRGLIVQTTGGLTLQGNTNGNTTARTLTIGERGITLLKGADFEANGLSGNGAITLALSGNQTWRNFNTDLISSSHNFILGVSATAASDVDLAGHSLTIAGDAGMMLSSVSTHGRIINSSGSGNIVLGSSGVLRFSNQASGLNGDRVDDSIGLTSCGGYIHYYLSSTAVPTNYSESVGTLTLERGSLNHRQPQVATNETLTFTYGGIVHPAGSLATIAFNPIALNSLGDAVTYARNKLVITGQGDTVLLGGWATAGVGSGYGFAAYSSTRGVYNNAGSVMTATANDAVNVFRDGTMANTSDVLVGGYILPGGDLDMKTRKMTIASGGLMFPVNNATRRITNGTLTAGASGGASAPLYTWATAPSIGDLSAFVGSVIVNNSIGSVDLVKSGSGSVGLGGSNTYSGKTVVNEGALRILNAEGTNYTAIADGTTALTVADTSRFALGQWVLCGAGTRHIVRLTPTNIVLNSTVANTYTTFTNLAVTGSIAASPTVEVLYGATLDVTFHRTSTWTLGADQVLMGNGTVLARDYGASNRTIQINGKVAPGSSAGTLTVTGDVAFANNSILAIEVKNALLGGDKWEAGYDRLVVAGTVDLGANAKLDISSLAGESLAVGDRLFIVENDGVDAVAGKFKTMAGTELNEGDVFTDEKNFKIHYAADVATGALSGGNDVALEVTSAGPTLKGSLLIVN